MICFLKCQSEIKEKMVEVDSGTKSVSNARRTYEALSTSAAGTAPRSTAPKDRSKCVLLSTVYFKSKFGAFPLAVFFGAFIYYYITFLIMSPTIAVAVEAPRVNL